MTINIENCTEQTIDESINDLIEKAINVTLDHQNCPYEAEVSVTIVSDEEIKSINNEHRGIDKVTDVLSFPLIQFMEPADFKYIEDNEDMDFFNEDTGELMLGDIVVAIDKAKAQSIEYGHSFERELGFLIVHSMLHLLGYDHEDESQTEIMFSLQEQILESMGLKR